MEHSPSLPGPLSVLGPKHSFSDAAARLYLEHVGGTKVTYADSMQEVWDAIEDDGALGMLPYINYSSQNVAGTVDRLVDQNWCICAEVMLNVRMNIGAWAPVAWEDVREVVSHEAALNQCYQFLHQNLRHAKQRKTNSTSAAAREVARAKDPSTIVLASRDAIQGHGLLMLYEGKGISNCELKDNPNVTHFMAVRRNDNGSPLPDPRDTYLGVVLTPSNHPGITSEIATIFKEEQMDLYAQPEKPIGFMEFSFLYLMERLGTPQTVERLVQRLRPYRPKWLGSWPERMRLWDPTLAAWRRKKHANG